MSGAWASGRLRRWACCAIFLSSLSALGLIRDPVRAAGLPARATGSSYVNETGHLRLVGKHGFTLDERGTMTGSFSGAIQVRLTAVSTSRVTAEVTIRPAGGSISGYASAAYRTAPTSAGFSGTITLRTGTGRYAHARGSNLSFSGTIRRSNDAVTVHMRGLVSD